MTARLKALIRQNERAGWALFDQGFVSLCNFATIYLLARFMEMEAFGIFVLGYTGLLFFVSIQQSAITKPHNILGAARDDDAYRHLSSVLLLVQLVLAMVLGCALVGIGMIFEAWMSYSTGDTLIALGIILTPWMTQEYVRRICYTQQESRRAFWNDAISYGLQLAGVVVFLYAGVVPSPSGALYVLGASSFVAALVGMVQIRHHLTLDRTTIRTWRPVLHEVWHFGKWLSGGTITQWFGQYGHVWLLGVMVGPALLGGYRAAIHLVNGLNPIQQAVYAYLPSRASKIYKEGGLDAVHTWMKKTFTAVFVPYLLLVFILVVFARPLLHLAYGDKFAGLHLEWIVMIGATAYLISFGKSYLQNILLAIGQARVIFLASVISVAMLATTGILAIHYLSVWGAPISQVLMAMVLLAYHYHVYVRLRSRVEEVVTTIPELAEP